MKRWGLLSVLLLAGALVILPGTAGSESYPRPWNPPDYIEGDPDDCGSRPVEGPPADFVVEDDVPRSAVVSAQAHSVVADLERPALASWAKLMMRSLLLSL